MIFKWSLLIACAYLCTSHAGFVDTLNKCSIKDVDCLKKLIKKIGQDIGKDGIKEYDIPPIDPIFLKELKVSVLNVLNFTLEDLNIKGITDCVMNDIDIQLEKGETVFDLTCDIVVEGKQKIVGSSPLFQNVLGGESVNSDGTFTLKLGKMQLSLTSFFKIVKKEDGDTYFIGKDKQYSYKYNIGDFHLDANNILLGTTDASEKIVGFANQNWKGILDSFGSDFFDAAIVVVKNVLRSFFKNMPTKYFIIEDLSSYVK